MIAPAPPLQKTGASVSLRVDEPGGRYTQIRRVGPDGCTRPTPLQRKYYRKVRMTYLTSNQAAILRELRKGALTLPALADAAELPPYTARAELLRLKNVR